MRLKKLHILPGTLVLLLTFALAVSGFAHRFSSPSDVAAESYAAAFGLSASDLCRGSGDDAAGQGCAACHLLASFHMPDPDDRYSLAGLEPGILSFPAAQASETSLIRDTVGHARAPPVA